MYALIKAIIEKKKPHGFLIFNLTHVNCTNSVLYDISVFQISCRSVEFFAQSYYSMNICLVDNIISSCTTGLRVRWHNYDARYTYHTRNITGILTEITKNKPMKF